MELAPGTLLGARFRLVRKLGAGSMGTVWAGEQVESRRPVALKLLLPEVSAHAEVCARFQREGLLLGRIRSKHAPRVLDFASDSVHGPFLVMELVPGQSLAEEFDRGPLSVERAIEVGAEIARALVVIHRAGIVHRDVKPANVLLREGRRPQRVVLVDFGLGRVVEGLAPRPERQEGDSMTAITRHDMAVGTIAYMAPEQVFDSSGVGAPADLYALGAILFRAVAGSHVFGDLQGTKLVYAKLTRDPATLDTGRSDAVAERFAGIVRRALVRLPDHRYQSAAEMLDELTALGRWAKRAHRSHAAAACTESPPLVRERARAHESAAARPSFADEIASVPRAMLYRLCAVGAVLVLAALSLGAALGARLSSPARAEMTAMATPPLAAPSAASIGCAASAISESAVSTGSAAVTHSESQEPPAPTSRTAGRRASVAETKHRELIRAMARAVGADVTDSATVDTPEIGPSRVAAAVARAVRGTEGRL